MIPDTSNNDRAQAQASQDRMRARWRRAQKARRAKVAQSGLVSLNLLVTPGEAEQLKATLEALRIGGQKAPTAPVQPQSMSREPAPKLLSWRERLAAAKGS